MVFNIPRQTHNRATISAIGNTIVLEGDIDHNDPGVQQNSPAGPTIYKDSFQRLFPMPFRRRFECRPVPW